MKKSNIILIGILFIIILTIAGLQLRVKNSITHVTETEIKYSQFNHIKIEEGWSVELYNDSLTKVIINNDSIAGFIKLENNLLTLKERSKGSKHKINVRIYNPGTTYFDLSGNSILYYHSNADDSLYVTLAEESNVVLEGYNREIDKETTEKEGTIRFLDFSASGHSRLNIYNHVNVLQGSLKDTSVLYINGEANIKKLEKSKSARINSW